MSLADPVSAKRSWRALVVEDDPDVLALLATHLRRMGWIVSPVGSGEEALNSAASCPPDLAVIDLLLPGIDGRQVLDSLRAAPETKDCLVVATSVLDPDDIGVECDAILPKPFGRREIDRVLGPLMRRVEKSA